MARIEREIARAVGLSRASVQKWRTGYPIAHYHVPALAEWAVRKAEMGPGWLRSFLQHCDYPQNDLQEQLFTSGDEPDVTPPERRSLPTPNYTRLFGVESLVTKIVALLSNPEGPRFVSIEGLGGIGKTALAQAVARRLAEQSDLSDAPCWVSARHEWISPQGELKSADDPARSMEDVVNRLAEELGQTQLSGLPTSEKLARLQPVLSEHKHLIVVDNLETMADSQDLLPALQPLSGASRFLLTSRHTLRHYPYIHVIPVPRLSFSDSYALVQSELDRRGYAADLPQTTMESLYELIGGLPLALKLAAAQIGRRPVEQILSGLRQANRDKPQTLYTYIYRQTWRLLNDDARKLLLSMLNVSPDGENLAWIRLTSMLPRPAFDAALDQLLDYSLLEVAQSLPTPVYRLHRLTVTFLQTEILLGWQDEENEESTV